MVDIINNPEHYGGKENTFEVIKIIEHFNLNFPLGNSVKYILRAGKKNPEKEIEDLEKARYYIERQIINIKKQKET